MVPLFFVSVYCLCLLFVLVSSVLKLILCLLVRFAKLYEIVHTNNWLWTPMQSVSPGVILAP